VLNDVADGEGEQLRNPEARFHAEEEKRAVTPGVTAAKALENFFNFGVGEWTTAFHAESGMCG
jgi:hypothetical protein